MDRSFRVAAAVAVAALGGAGPARAEPAYVERPHDLFAEWSPDGAEIAFTRRSRDTAQLRVVDAAGAGERGVVAARMGFAFVVSPDWARIAWTDGSALYVSPREPPAPTVVYRTRFWVDPMWVDDRRLLYSAEGVPPLVEHDVLTGAERRVPGFPSPVDVERYAFLRSETGRYDIVVADRDRRREVVLARDVGSAGNSSGRFGYRRIRWAPNGATVAFTRVVGGRAVIDVVAADGTGHRSFSTPADFERDVFTWNWGPEAQSITYAIDTWGKGSTDGVYRLDVATGAQARLTNFGSSPDWSPDGTTLVLSANGECEQAGLFLLTLEPRRLRRLTNSCRIAGTARADHLIGTDDFDILLGLDGNDHLEADVNHFTYNRDELHGGRGADTIRGGSGPDAIFGDAGDDRIDGGARRDVVRGGPGRDLIDAGRGRDLVYARDGERDTIICGPNAEAAPAKTPDVVYADRIDIVARDCERVSRR
jgi:hypothetical protein